MSWIKSRIYRISESIRARTASKNLYHYNIISLETYQETPLVEGKVKNIYLRFGNIESFAELLQLPEQENFLQ